VLTAREHTMDNVEFHPVTEIFPLMEGEEFDQLVASIKANGLEEAIRLHPDGRIIDGRNRYRACLQAGVEPHYRTWEGEGSLVTLVVNLNLHRRHLTASQRAAITMEILPKIEAEARERQAATLAKPGERADQREHNIVLTLGDAGKSSRQVARFFNVSPTYVEHAKKINNRAPEKIAEIRAGTKTIPEVMRELKLAGVRPTRSQPAETKNAAAPGSHHPRRRRALDDTLTALDELADAQAHSDAEIGAVVGDVARFLQRVTLIPWLAVERAHNRTVFKIDDDLRAICEERRPRPDLNSFSVVGFLKNLRAEITRRRKENHDERIKRRWNPDNIVKREQTSMLDWIEAELDRVP